MKANYKMLFGFLALAVLLIDAGIAHATPTVRVPEPTTLTLLGSGAAALGAFGLLRRFKK